MLALIDTEMYGIPFQEINICKDGLGPMKGGVAKNITIFNMSFDFIDNSYLAEYLISLSFTPKFYISR